ncbi:hypothetical protein L2302_08370 [Lactobacillus gasseri]|uniref:SA1002 family membrane protein n=1 Tax=Lactobacillus gasseri TaxID=1596 RepID=UPI0011940F8A|nr:hypothetical protein [Lactobacillus gasseri]MCZ3483984.1 hypothetical protein [Lactobacillus gasseri]MCZ3485870.1 hypothetical protein [Lactobacillus gasseri]MCZ3492673.1 hypothetical protein [Lactobacillus gasseri]MCZ3510314.1 hypothetical protein [Lactobacillus gasseri]MCZ3851717.1 hypothetical protein [Lactobacillus gasseri]
MQVLPIFLIILAVVIAGYIFTSKNRFYFLKAIILFLALLIFSTINFLIFFGVVINRIHDMKLGNLFLLLGALVILSGLFLYEGLKKFNKFHQISEITLTLIEYCIQWSLIYVTVYQSIFNNIAKIHTITKMIKTVRILNPDLLVVIVLPSFISIWIAVVLLKKYQHDL